MKSSTHTSEEAIVRFVLGDLGPEDERSVEAHLRTCVDCSALKRSYASTVDLLRSDRNSQSAGDKRIHRNLKDLLDSRIDYEVLDLPNLDKVLIGVSRRGLCYLAFVVGSEREAVTELARLFSGRPLFPGEGRTHALGEMLERYASGRLRRFRFPIDLSAVRGPFHRHVLQVTSEIPFGQVLTYGDIARKVGRPRAYRAVGGALNRNPIAVIIPCHRVVASDGSLRGYRWGLDRKERLLQLEGALSKD